MLSETKKEEIEQESEIKDDEEAFKRSYKPSSRQFTCRLSKILENDAKKESAARRNPGHAQFVSRLKNILKYDLEQQSSTKTKQVYRPKKNSSLKRSKISDLKTRGSRAPHSKHFSAKLRSILDRDRKGSRLLKGRLQYILDVELIKEESNNLNIKY